MCLFEILWFILSTKLMVLLFFLSGAKSIKHSVWLFSLSHLGSSHNLEILTFIISLYKLSLYFINIFFTSIHVWKTFENFLWCSLIWSFENCLPEHQGLRSTTTLFDTTLLGPDCSSSAIRLHCPLICCRMRMFYFHSYSLLKSRLIRKYIPAIHQYKFTRQFKAYSCVCLHVLLWVVVTRPECHSYHNEEFQCNERKCQTVCTNLFFV